MYISKQDINKYNKCKANLHRCKYVGITDCAGCEYDLTIDKIAHISS